MAEEKNGKRAGDAPAGGGGLLPSLLVVTLIAAAMGAGSAALMMEKKHEPAAAENAAEPAHGAHGKAGAPESILNLPPIVTNLETPRSTWVRLEATLTFAAPTEKAEDLGAQVAGDILAYMRTMTLAQLEGPTGLQNLREDLRERAATRSKGKVSDVVIRALVTQ